MGRNYDSSLFLGRKSAKTPENPAGFEAVDRIDPDEACLLILGGSETRDPKIAACYANKAELGVIDAEGIDAGVYAAVYDYGHYAAKSAALDMLLAAHLSHGRPVPAPHMVPKPDEMPQYYMPAMVNDLYDAVVAPRIEGASVADASRNMRKVTFWSHCFGATIALRLGELMDGKMEEAGRPKEDRRAILGQTLVVAHQPASPLGAAKTPFISFCYGSDINYQFSDFAKYVNELIRQNDRKLSVFEPGVCWLPGRRGNVFGVDRIYRPEAGHPFNVSSGEHGFESGYFVNDKMTPQGMEFLTLERTVLANALRSSVAAREGRSATLPRVAELSGNAKRFKEMTAAGKTLCARVRNGLRTPVGRKLIDLWRKLELRDKVR